MATGNEMDLFDPFAEFETDGSFNEEGAGNTIDLAAKAVEQAVTDAETKLQKEAKDPMWDTMEGRESFKYLIMRVREDDTFAMAVAQEHKTFRKAMEYAGKKAMELEREKLKTAGIKGSPQSAMVSSDTVFGWFEEYYRLDDKAEAEKKAAEERAQKEAAAKRKQEAEEQKKKAAEEKAAKKEEEAKKKSLQKNQVDGQIDLFSFL